MANEQKHLSAADILGNPNYQAISYGGYRGKSRKIQPTISQLKEDMRILAAMNIKLLRTYNTHFLQASNLLQAIEELKSEDPNFEMYIMLGAWIDCEHAFTHYPNHDREHREFNQAEIDRAAELAVKYPEIIKIIAVGNEAMVKWAASYYVQPNVILKYVNYLQNLKKKGDLPSDLWITSSDNFASWGGGSEEYHVNDLEHLYHAVDFVSLHTYPMHDTFYHPIFWGIMLEETSLNIPTQVDLIIDRAVEYAKFQYNSVIRYMKSLGIDKPVHIGETGWASFATDHYGDEGSKACDEYKEGIYYKKIREWTDAEGISCFYFEAFDEPWKDAGNPGGSENHFGLFTVKGEAKYAIWNLVDEGVFDGLKRGRHPIVKTFDGELKNILDQLYLPEIKEIAFIE